MALYRFLLTETVFRKADTPASSRTVRQAFFISWVIMSLAGILIVLTPFAVAQAQMDRMLPPCQWQVLYHKPCPFCGMTTGFYHLCRGEGAKALKANSLAPWLFGLFILNGLTCLTVLTLKLSAFHKKTILRKGT